MVHPKIELIWKPSPERRPEVSHPITNQIKNTLKSKKVTKFKRKSMTFIKIMKGKKETKQPLLF